jgi:hypothetical protein
MSINSTTAKKLPPAPLLMDWTGSDLATTKSGWERPTLTSLPEHSVNGTSWGG